MAAVAGAWLLSVGVERITFLPECGCCCCCLAAECWGGENYPFYLSVAAVAAAWLLSVGVERITLSTWVWLLLLLPGC